MIRPLVFTLAAFAVLSSLTVLYSGASIGFSSYQRGEMVLDSPSEADPSTSLSVKEVDGVDKVESLIFVGDIMLGRHVEVLSKRYGLEYPFNGIDIAAVASNTAVIGNFESSMAEPHHMTPAYTMRFSTHIHVIPQLRKAGFTHVSLANNHSLDYGEAGYTNTLNALLQNDIVPFGHGRRLDAAAVTIIETSEGRLALIGINAVYNVPTNAAIETVFNEVAVKSDFQIAYIHFGDEYALVHSDNQRAIAQMVIAAGADLVIGHHPHVVQDIDVVDGVLVFYSLGNYIFDQYFSSAVQEGLILLLTVSPHPRIQLFPVESITQRSQPRHMSVDSRVLFLDTLAQRSALELREFIKEGEIPLGQLVATSSKIAMIEK